MKSLILSRLWMLIGIIILTTGQAWAHTTGSTSGSTTTQKVFTSIKELRDGANGKSLSDVVIQFEATNPATVVAVMTKQDPDIEDKKFINSFFIVDNKSSDGYYYGLWVSPNDIKMAISCLLIWQLVASLQVLSLVTIVRVQAEYLILDLYIKRRILMERIILRLSI